MKYVEMEEEKSSNADESASDCATGNGVTSNPASPKEKTAVTPSPPSHDSKEESTSKKSQNESQSGTAEAEPQMKTMENGGEKSETLDLFKGSRSVPRLIPQPKRNPKKTLNELHQQLLKKLDPNLVPSSSASLPEIFRNGVASDPAKPTENDASNAQKQPSDTATIDSRNALSPLRAEETSNGLMKSPAPPDTPTSRLSEKGGLYRCSVGDCASSFNRINDLKSHISSVHPGLDSFPCSFCFEASESLESMTDHLKAHIKNVFKCSHCQMASDTKEELLNHIAVQHPGQPKKITIYVKILNNDRQKKVIASAKASDAANETKTDNSPSFGNNKDGSMAENAASGDSQAVGKTRGVSPSIDKTVTELATASAKPATTEFTKSRSSRKSSKPVKVQKDPSDDLVQILPAERSMTVTCDRCSFTCDSDVQLKSHSLSGHASPNSGGLFKCKVCKMSTDNKSTFQQHMAYHTGRHIIRYYICPYCKVDTTSMDLVEEHVGDKHPSEAFRFEVLQETIEFLQDLLECPVCKGSFMWKEYFLQHVASVHRLDDLAEHLREHTPGTFPGTVSVPKSLLRNLLPETTDFEDLPPEPTIVSSDDEGSGVGIEGKDQSVGETLSICVQQSSTKDGEKILQFHCETCNYVSYEYEKYTTHLKTHSIDKSESLIKKLLTKPTGPDEPCAAPTGFEAPRSATAILASNIPAQRTGGLFHCHLCPFQCSKTVHFKRHLAIHARNETLTEGYKCGYCQFAHYRLNCVKFHLGKYHGDLPHKMIRIADGIEIELGADDDPGRVKKSPSAAHSITSTPFLRTASEKRPTARYEESLVPNLPRSFASGSRSSPIASDRSQDISLMEFELQLPPSMIYREPLKCPKCDFTNRVRVNLQRHLKLHREEANEEIMEDSSELRRLMLEEVPSRTKVATGMVVKREEPVATVMNKRSQVLDEKPLLRSILCEKPAQVAKSEPEMDESDISNNDSPLEDHDSGTTPHANVSKDYSDFSIRLPKTDQYQCKECAFVHRYPSKVKRHYYYKHITVCPYKCGYCTFEGVEIGKVKRHCQQMHRDQPELVLKRDVFASASNSADVGVSSTNDCVDVEIIDETISRDKGDGQGDRWLPQFVIKVDNSLQCCRLCGFQQEGSMSLKRHVFTKHLKFYPFSCNYCGVALMEIQRVKRHIEKYHAGMPLVVIRRRLEDMPKDDSELTAVNPGKTSSAKVYVKTEPEEEEEVEEVEEEAPQLDFYPKAESDDVGGLSDSTSWKEDGREESVEGEVLDESVGDNVTDLSGHGRSGIEADELEAFSGGNHRRLFKCVYCGIISKWNRRDIRLHIMHVHMRRRVYTCRHCSFGNSKSKAVVRNHCAKFHPHKPVSVRDDLALFNAVIPIEDKNGIVTMAFSDRKGVPLLNIEDLESDPKLKAKVDPPKPPTLMPSRPAVVERDALEVDEESDERRNVAVSSSKRSRSSSGPSLRPVPGSRPPRGKVENREEPKAVVKTEAGGSVKEKSEWRCKLCGFINQNASHVKYHLICYHMKLKPFSCPYCHLYIWKSQGVISHIEKHHPGREKKIYATVEEKSAYLCSKIEKVVHGVVVEKKPEVVEKPVATDTGENGTSSQKISYFRCGLCGYQDVRNDKTKYHIIKQHLQLRQFSCPHCHLYMWGRQQVMKHIEEEHPGMEVSITRTFQEYEDYLKQNITKVSAPALSESLSEDDAEEETASIGQRSSTLTSPASSSLLCLRCNKCSFVTDSEMSLSAHKRSHRMFQCFHCDFQHMLAAKVQIHCLTKHPNKLVKYRQCDTSTQSVTPPAAPTTKAVRSAASSARSDRFSENSSGEQSNSKVFHPCDVCPAHFNTATELERHLSQEHHGMYICNYCHIVMWNSMSMREHLGKSHPNRPPEFRVIKKEPTETGSSTRKRSRATDASDVDSEDSPRKMPKLEPSDPSDFQVSETLAPASVSTASHDYVSAIYKCRLCNYKSGKVTVMRHHAMSHLRYHPYLCPYCDLVRSVKSFPITKHVRSKHPDREQRFIYARNEDLEKQVKDSYYRSKPSDPVEPRETVAVEEPDEKEVVDEEPMPVESISALPSTLPRKVLYKCTFCSLKTHIRTDMKHHLMREIQYKPYRCMYCTYTEPCKWSMRKHFRTKHGGIEVEVEDMRDSENDARVEKLLEKCTVLLKHTVDPELLSWKPSPTPQRRVHQPQAVPTGSKAVSNSVSKPSFGVSLLRRSFKGSKSMAMKFHRCPHCPYTNTSVKLVRGHMVKHGPFRLQCGYCDYRGHYPSRIRKHMRRHHPSMPFKYSKVALPPKDQKAEEIPVIHVPRSQVKTQNKPAPGTVFLDGVPMDIPLIPNSQGLYRCLQCDYQSVNREHYKMHVVIHRPPKWKCFYCEQKYPVIFRLRRHSNQKHPNLPIRWVDMETGQSSIDTLKPSTTTNRQSGGKVIYRETARKSTSKGARLQVAMFRSHPKSSRQRNSQQSQSDSDATIVDKTPFVIGEPYSLVSSDSESEVAVESNVPTRLCCHLCAFKTSERADFAQHLEKNHVELNDSVIVEVLPRGDDSGEVFALRRCGFCTFETYVEQEFEAHVRTHTTELPFRCESCSYASFNRQKVEDHVVDCHPGSEVGVRRLKEPYTMTTGFSGHYWSVNLDAFVELEDVMKISDEAFESVLGTYGVSYDGSDRCVD